MSAIDQDSVFRFRVQLWVGIGTGVIAFIVYAFTCFPTVTWWDSLDYTTCAVCLGIPGPPGSLMATLLGWIVTRFVPIGSQSFALNLFSALLAATTAALVAWVGVRLISLTDDSSATKWRSGHFLAVAGAAIGALSFAFSDTLWLHATKFTPYVLTACLTAVLIWQLLRWWHEADNPGAWRRLLLIAFLFGLDFSVHRTNLLLIPGVFVWVLLRQPRLYASVRCWLLACLSLAAGLSVHLLLIPMAAAHPATNFNDPSTLARFWDYVSLKQFGGGFLVGLFPRKAPFLSYQVADYLRVFGSNFCSISGFGSVLGGLPLVFGCLGFVSLVRENWKLALGALSLFLCVSLGAIIYFNIPPDFFRPFDRHYLPSFVLFAIFTAYGLAVTFEWLKGRLARRRILLILGVAIALLLLPGIQLKRNWQSHDGSRNYIAYDFGRNLLNTLPEGSVLFTYGDNDTFSSWYLQRVEHFRPDVTVINTWLLNTPWFVRQILAADTLLPLTLTPEQVEQIGPKRWPDTTLAIAVDGFAADTARFRIPPFVQNAYMMPHDWIVAQMISENRFRRPLFFSAGGGSNISPWISDHLRSEGLVFRLMPDTAPEIDLGLVRSNLLEGCQYRGWADSTVTLDYASLSMAPVYWQAFVQYLAEVHRRGDSSDFVSDLARLQALMPPSRCPTLPPSLREWLKSAEKGVVSSGSAPIL